MINEKENANVQMNAVTHSPENDGLSKIMENNGAGIAKYDFMSAVEISEFLGIGKTQAYEICKKINAKLAQMGFLTFRGKVPRKALFEQLPH